MSCISPLPLHSGQGAQSWVLLKDSRVWKDRIHPTPITHPGTHGRCVQGAELEQRQGAELQCSQAWLHASGRGLLGTLGQAPTRSSGDGGDRQEAMCSPWPGSQSCEVEAQKDPVGLGRNPGRQPRSFHQTEEGQRLGEQALYLGLIPGAEYPCSLCLSDESSSSPALT